MNIKKKILKPYHGIIALILSLIVMIVVSPILGAKIGLYASLVGELLFLMVAVGVVLVFRGDFKTIFPMKKIRVNQFFGSFLLWVATVFGGLVITIILSYFFPKEVLGISKEIGKEFFSIPFLPALIIIAVSPAICEEALFRGVVLNSFSCFKNKWIAIILSSVIFGVFHGSIWRFMPTALLGVVFAYIVLETKNIWYSIIFHFLNNGTSFVLMYTLNKAIGSSFSKEISNSSMNAVPLMSVAIYIILSSGIPFCLYIGNYLLLKKKDDEETGLFPKEKRKMLITLILLTISWISIGVILMVVSTYVDREFFREIIQKQI